MRKTLLAFAALGALGTGLAIDTAPANAQYGPLYPWCAQYGSRGGSTNCYFSNLWQCQQAISGNGGWCYENPFYAQAASNGAQRRARRNQ